MGFKKWQEIFHEIAREKGWLEDPPDVGRQVALIHSEVFEVLGIASEYRVREISK